MRWRVSRVLGERVSRMLGCYRHGSVCVGEFETQRESNQLCCVFVAEISINAFLILKDNMPVC